MSAMGPGAAASEAVHGCCSRLGCAFRRRMLGVLAGGLSAIVLCVWIASIIRLGATSVPTDHTRSWQWPPLATSLPELRIGPLFSSLGGMRSPHPGPPRQGEGVDAERLGVTVYDCRFGGWR